MEIAPPAAPQGTENGGEPTTPTAAEPMEDVSTFSRSFSSIFLLDSSGCSTYEWYCSW